ncbi:facilitated trehalose transporter Tret1-like [Spodoptera litura]|uniref:Facilitated trehalose transporter Tret1-like n=1 Tax=Spodoptera litura TaxID=69820 RepID=A0A9J7EES6_SPOLT|nr:facilitated trehalose transporter Tret1-like [Spodoptera litura]
MYTCGSPILRQYLVIITANLAFVSIGLSVSWSSPVLVKLMNKTEPVLSRPITYEEGSWIASIGSGCGLILNFTIGFILDKLGRKTCMILGFVPRLVMCIMLLFTKEVWVVYLARVFDGFANASILAAVPTYSSEIASKECRGALGTISQVASGLGMLIFLSIGPFLPYYELHVMYTCITVTICLPLWFIPETPYYLYSKGYKKKSLNTLIYLRGSEEIALEEMKLYSLSQPKISKREIFKDRTTLKTLGKVVLLTMFLELIGYNAVLFYMQTILQSTHTSVSEQIASVVNGCIQLVASFCTIFTTDRFGRKPILITSLMGMTLGMLGLGTFFQLKSIAVATVGFLNFLPLLSMMLVIFCFNAGMGSLCFTVVAELFDGPARAVGVSVAIGVATFFAFLLTKYFVYVSFAIGDANVYWIFSSTCIITILFILFFIPETKGKTFTEIQEELGRHIEKTDLK